MKQFLIATAIMLIMTACSGAFIDPGMQDSNGLGGGSSPNNDDNGGGGGNSYSSGNDDVGGKSSSSGNTLPSVDCSRYQSEYSVRKAQVERWERTVASSQSTYDNLVRNGASYSSISGALTTLTQAKNELRTAQSNLTNAQRQAASAGCSVY